MQVLVGMSGGVDSSVAAAILLEAGHDVVGATMRLWSGSSDSGCCQVSDVIDARRVCDSLGIEHLVFDMTEEFESSVVQNFTESHQQGLTPNPCVECNRHLKFRTFLDKATRLGFDGIATGHHARIERDHTGTKLLRGVDHRKDQSYVLSVLTQEVLEKCFLPIGEMTKEKVRSYAANLGLRTAAKPDSQDLCFISSLNKSESRSVFLRERIAFHSAKLIAEDTGEVMGEIPAIELVTVGQRRGLSFSAGVRKYVTKIDMEHKEVFVGIEEDLLVAEVELRQRTVTNGNLAEGRKVQVQVSAHGRPHEAVISKEGIVFVPKARRVAPGQIVSIYDGDEVLGSGIAC